MLAEVWCGLCYDVKVSFTYILLIKLIIPCSRHPDDLYKNGIQRSSFIPCIELIKARFDVTDLDSGTGTRNSLFPPSIPYMIAFRLPANTTRVIARILPSINA